MSAATVTTYSAGARQLIAYLAELTTHQIRALLKLCEGRDFVSRRDAAIIRLFADTGMRLSELAGLTLDDVGLDSGIAAVLGKGRRPRACPYGAKTAAEEVSAGGSGHCTSRICTSSSVTSRRPSVGIRSHHTPALRP